MSQTLGQRLRRIADSKVRKLSPSGPTVLRVHRTHCQNCGAPTDTRDRCDACIDKDVAKIQQIFEQARRDVQPTIDREATEQSHTADLMNLILD